MADNQPQQTVADYEAGTGTAGKLCSICQSPIMGGERVLDCPFCALPFHSDCWKENRGCSAYGCKGAPPTAKTNAAPEALSNAWAGEKPCPSCGTTIKANALKCRYCGAAFDTRDVIPVHEYARREYDGQEYAAVRNKIIALFLLSAAGCLSPLALILLGVLVGQKNFMGIDYNRLPAALKAVVWCAMGVSVLMLVILVCMLAFD